MNSQPTLYEIDGRIIELIRQRDEALARCAILAGHLANLQAQLPKEEPKPIVVDSTEEK